MRIVKILKGSGCTHTLLLFSLFTLTRSDKLVERLYLASPNLLGRILHTDLWSVFQYKPSA